MKESPCHHVILSLYPGFRRVAVIELRQVVYGLLISGFRVWKYTGFICISLDLDSKSDRYQQRDGMDAIILHKRLQEAKNNIFGVRRLVGALDFGDLPPLEQNQ